MHVIQAVVLTLKIWKGPDILYKYITMKTRHICFVSKCNPVIKLLSREYCNARHPPSAMCVCVLGNDSAKCGKRLIFLACSSEVACIKKKGILLIPFIAFVVFGHFISWRFPCSQNLILFKFAHACWRSIDRVLIAFWKKAKLFKRCLLFIALNL